MDPKTLVKEQIDFGAMLIDHLAKGGFEVTTAFWVKSTENGRWYFYIVSPIMENDHRNSYGRLLDLMRQLPRPYWIDPLGIRLLGPSDKLAMAIRDLCRRHPGFEGYPMRWGEIWLGTMNADESYVYPIHPVAAQ